MVINILVQLDLSNKFFRLFYSQIKYIYSLFTRQFSCSATFSPKQTKELFQGFLNIFSGLVTIEANFLYFGKPVWRETVKPKMG